MLARLTAGAGEREVEHDIDPGALAPSQRERRRQWARLIAKVFEVDPLRCVCGATMRVVSFILSLPCGRFVVLSSLARERDRPLPRFVEREFRGFLECGILAHGFLRVHCDACGRDRIVAFSCKGRGSCPSCLGRRMADTGAHIVDRVLPEVPVRQGVLTVPFALRYRLACDAVFTSVVLREFVRGAFASYRRRARQHGPSGGHGEVPSPSSSVSATP